MPCPKRCHAGSRCNGSRCVATGKLSVRKAAKNAVMNQSMASDEQRKRLAEKLTKSASSDSKSRSAANRWLSRYKDDPRVQKIALKFIELLVDAGKTGIVYAMLRRGGVWSSLARLTYSRGIANSALYEYMASKSPAFAALAMVMRNRVMPR